MISAPANVLDFEEALALLRREAEELSASRLGSRGLELETEEVGLLDARGRVLAEALCAGRDQPPFDRATRDGFAVRAGRFSSGAALRVAGTVRAGERWTGREPGPDEALEIMTGAPVPAGTDAVAMMEHVAREGDRVRPEPGRSWQAGENIVRRGSEARAGDAVLTTGTEIAAAEIALAASCGRGRLQVFRRPHIAIVATGDELVELTYDENRELEEQQIWDSNTFALAAMVLAAGGEPVRLPIARDRREETAASLREARRSDLVVFSGGVSMGQYDLVEEMLLEAGAEFFFTGVRMQPGKPVVFGRLPAAGEQPERFFFGLPGNPISTQVTFHCFVEPFLRSMSGAADARPRRALARLAHQAERRLALTRLLPARMVETEVRVVGWQGSGDLPANARANCYVELPAGHGVLEAGSIVRVLLR